MATFTWTAQGANGSGTLTIDATDQIWFTSGTNLTDNVTVSSYQDGTHISLSDGTTHKTGCATMTHVNNLKYLTSSTVSINGAGSVSLSGSVPTAAQMTLKVNFSDGASVATSAAKFWAYDGSVDANVWAGVTVQAFQRTQTSWTAANGLSAAVTLADQAAATSHDFLIGISATPTSTGAKTGAWKISLTYV